MVRKTDHLDMTMVVDWDIKPPKTKQNQKLSYLASWLAIHLVLRNKIGTMFIVFVNPKYENQYFLSVGRALLRLGVKGYAFVISVHPTG